MKTKLKREKCLLLATSLMKRRKGHKRLYSISHAAPTKAMQAVPNQGKVVGGHS